MIVAHSYDIESGRKDLAARGRSDAHEMVSIPIHRDGGLTDLLAEDRPDCHEYHRRSPRRPEGTAVRVDVAGRSSRVAVGMWCVADRRVAGVRRRLDPHGVLDRQPPPGSCCMVRDHPHGRRQLLILACTVINIRRLIKTEF